MKIRTGFVSNSSSSSFIIRVNDSSKKEPCECCGRPFEDALRMLNLMVGNYDCTEFIPILEACNERDYLIEWINENPTIVNRNVNNLYCGDISYHNEARLEYLRNSNDIEILEMD